MMTPELLLEQYYESASEGTSLRAYLQQILEGSLGQPNRPAILEFVDQVERIVLGNMMTHGDYDGLADAEDEFHMVRTWILNIIPAPSPS